MMSVILTDEGHEEPSVRYAFHGWEYPLRWDKSRGSPRMLPASRMNGFSTLADFAFSNWSRTICPCDKPVREAVSSSQEESSLLRRIVIV